MRQLNLLKTQSLMPLSLPNIYLSIVTIETLKKDVKYVQSFFTVDFEQTSHLFLMFRLLILNK